ncbi:inositol monophosphatase [Microstroma glucosiphilum]|uniref:Inositol monophosphatase n=1 Tax=Pseudomicrostroma glucosiphilum TaxID=1684307 RepID=A0A316U5D1_9BASI|nr:inositol monophosphatase [Pseudomicrostroma glucosiphilum]PWN20467.1 inositol monophosphatase [Pseudomicrostroma glucosiphilum]
MVVSSSALPDASTETSSMIDLEAIHDFATDLAVRAGALLRQAAFSRSQAGYLPPPVASSSSSSSNDTSLSETPDLDVRDKQSNVDIVTETDLRVEKFILEEIQKRYPGHALLAEETYAAGGSKRFGLTDEATWIVDPLDGTVNFLHLFPFVCVSIGFTINKVPVVGAIYAPMLGGLDPRASGGTLWSSCQGRGAYQSYPSTTDSTQCSLAFLERYACSAMPRPQPVTSTTPAATTAGATTSTTSTSADPSSSSSSSAAPQPPGPQPLRLPLQPTRPLSRQAPSGLLIASEWGKDRRANPDGNLLRKANSFLNLAGEKGSRNGLGGQIQGLRSMGSAALDLAFCASGTIDVFWEGGCWEWDVCAGLAVLYEAGGIATEGNAPPPDLPLWDSKSGMRLPRPSLGARRFLCVRPCLVGSPAGEKGEEEETAVQAQERVVRSIWQRLHLGGLAYQREGVEYAY